MKLKLQFFGHLMQWTDSFEKTPMLGKIEGGRRSGRQSMRWMDGITNSMDMSLSKVWELGQGGLVCYSPWSGKESDMTEWLNWTDFLVGPNMITPSLRVGYLWDSWSFPGNSISKESSCNAGDLNLFPGLGGSPGVGNGYPFQYSCLENSTGRGAWKTTVHGAANSQIQLRD